MSTPTQASILYHANCPDGFGAAYSAWKKFGQSAEFYPVKHGEAPPKIAPESEVYIIDFAYDRETLLNLNTIHPRVQVLDHHKTAQEDLAGLEFAEFDMNRSGAVMSWQFFHPGTEVPLLLQYVQDQDLWNWALEDSQAICTALSMYPFDFEIWDKLQVSQLQQEGQVVLRYKQQMIDKLLGRVDWYEILGDKVPVVNTPLFASELGNQLCEAYPDARFSASFSEMNGQRKFSLRSIGENDVSAVAKHFGGGGHRNASGFAIPQSGHPDVKRLDS